MKNRLLLAIAGIIVFASCTRISTTEIGTGLIPPIDNVNTFDTTIEVTAENFIKDTIRVQKTDEHVLGYITTDPLFGSTEARVNFELKPSFFPYYFETSNQGDSLQLDSAVLVLSYRGIWGDTTNPITLTAYEMGSKLKVDSVYPSYTQVPIGAQLGQVTISDPRRLTDSVKPLFEAATNQIRIKLNNSIGQKLLKTFDSTDAYKSDSLFSERFHGFSVVPTMGSNSLLRVALTDTNTKLALYYRFKPRSGPADNIDTTVRFFKFVTSNCANTNDIRRNRSGSQFNQFLTNTPGIPDSLVFLQTAPGSYVKIKTPGLIGLTNRVVHRAELIMEEMPDVPAYDNIYTEPYLFLSAYSSDSARRIHIPKDVITSSYDFTVTNFATLGGRPIYKADNNGNRVASYNFDISRYVQDIATNKAKVYDLYLNAPWFDFASPTELSPYSYPLASSAINPPAIGRVRLFGGTSLQNTKKMRIRIIYSKLK